MGLTVESIRFLLEARRGGATFDSVLTLGRQDLWVGPERLLALLQEFDGDLPASVVAQMTQRLQAATWRTGEFFRLLGCRQVMSCDASAYEGAELIHDLNEPLPSGWHERFDLVLDGGTLEHVFNLPTSLANCLHLAKPGGRVILFTPANNYCGHGFFQFSPELFWRVLGPANGFQMERLQAMVDTEGFASLFGVKYPFPITGARYDVSDPARIGQRVLLVNRAPTLLFVQARKVASVEPFQTWPQQSDYTVQWQDGSPLKPLAATMTGGGLAGWLLKHFPESFCRELLPKLAGWITPWRKRRFLRSLSFANRAAYRPASRDRSAQ